MKVRFYVDLCPGIDPAKHALMAWTTPAVKTNGAKRLAFDVAIPDALIFGFDSVSPEVGNVDVVKDHDE